MLDTTPGDKEHGKAQGIYLSWSLQVRLTFSHTRPLRAERKSGARKTPSVEDDMVREHLNTLDILKSIGHDGRHP